MIQRQKIKPAIDVPMVMQLETVQGRESKSQFTGVEYWFNVVFDSQPSIIYLPDEGREAIESLRPQVGDYVELLKQKRGKQELYSAQLVSDGAEEPAPPPPPQRQPVRMLAPASRTAATNGPPSNGGYTNGAPRPSMTATAQAQAMPPDPDAQISPVAQQLAGCLRVSLDAWEQTRQYAHDKYGVALDYTSEDVRAVGLSFYIGRTRDGGR